MAAADIRQRQDTLARVRDNNGAGGAVRPDKVSADLIVHFGCRDKRLGKGLHRAAVICALEGDNRKLCGRAIDGLRTDLNVSTECAAFEVEDHSLILRKVDLVFRAVLLEVVHAEVRAHAVNDGRAGHAVDDIFHGSLATGRRSFLFLNACNGDSCRCRRSGGGHIAGGNRFVKEAPCQLGVIDERVAVALDVLHYNISAHFPCINGIALHPVKEDSGALEDTGNIGILAGRAAVADVEVKDDSGNIALDLVKRLEIGRAVVAADGAVDKRRALGCRAVTDIAELFAAAQTIGRHIVRANMVQIGARAALGTVAEALRPDVLTVPAGCGAAEVALACLIAGVE